MPETPHILLVEDNDLDVEILKRGMQKARIDNPIIRAIDGLDALEMLQKHVQSPASVEPLVILLDINMPRMNGHDFLREMRAIPEIASHQVFVFTTSNSSTDIAKAFEQNANGYFVKPTGMADLVPLLITLKNYWDHCCYPTQQNPVQ
ncbi:MAG: response regulator [Pseudomonadota bacterium]